MKILLDSYNNCCQNKAGGVQNKILDLYKNLKSHSYDLTLFNKWEHKIEDYDILHLFKVSFEYWSEISYAKSLGKKVILSSIIPLNNRLKIKLDLLLCKLFHVHTANYFTKRIFETVDIVVTETIKEKRFIEDVFGISSSKISVIPNGISLDLERADPSLFREKYNVVEDFVIQVGRIDRNKNLLSVIKALKNTGIHLVVVGGPASDEMAYFQECKKESDETVHFVGWIAHEDPLLASALKAAKVLVLPSHNEIFGNAVFEGAMAGCNIVLTEALPYKEWNFGDKAYPINPDSIDDIRCKLLKAFEDPVDKTVAEDVYRYFSIDAVSKRHVELYEKVSK